MVRGCWVCEKLKGNDCGLKGLLENGIIIIIIHWRCKFNKRGMTESKYVCGYNIILYAEKITQFVCRVQ